MRTSLGIGLAAILMAGCGYDTVVPSGTGAVAHDGGLGVGVSGSATLTRGNSGQITVTVSRPTGFTGTVDLSAETLPAGISASFAPETVAASSTTSVLTLTASGTAALGIGYPTVRARGAGVTDATVTVTVNVTQ